MKILKVINNNVASAYDENGKEIVVMGKGIAFQKKSGDKLDENLIEKKYSLPDESTSQFEALVKDMPYEHITTASRIISYASKILPNRLNKNIYITLTDHLNFAVERMKREIPVENALLWEIKRFYPVEFQIGLKALEVIQEDLGISLSEDEAGFFALHIVNAEMDGDMHKTMDLPQIIKDVTNIVNYTFGTIPDESNLYFERFVTHLKFFLERALKGIEYENNNDEFNDMVRNQFPESHRCALRIRSYLRARLHCEVSDEEITYLTMHIQRIMNTRA